MISIRTNISILALIAVMGCPAPHGAFAQADAKSIYQAAEPSVYIIYVNNSKGDAIALGSGFLIGPRRIITNAHVVRDGSPVIAVGPVRIPAKIERTDEVNDLALLSVDVDLTSKPLRLSSDKAETGDPAFVIGNPEGLEKTLSQGIVSGIRKQDGRSLLQITSPISHGSSGGPVLNAKGEVEGVAVATLTEGQNLNFAVPANAVVAFLSANQISNSVDEKLILTEIRTAIQNRSEEYSGDKGSSYQMKTSAIAGLMNTALGSNDPSVLLDLSRISASEDYDTSLKAAQKSERLKDSPDANLAIAVAFQML